MKRILSWVLTFVMVLGMFGSFSVQFALASDLNEYDALVTPGSSVYGDTYVVNSEWTADMLTEGTTLTYVFRGKTYSEVYDATRHFNTFGSAQDQWYSRYTTNGVLTAEVTKHTPNYILLGEILRTDLNGNPMGTVEEKNTCLSDMWIRFSANLYGATAGVDPNNPNYDPATALPGSDWALNPEWQNPTILKTTIFQSTRVDRNQNTTDPRYEKLLTEAGVNHLTLKLDGLQFNATNYNDVCVWQYGVTGYQREVDLVVKNTVVNGNNGTFQFFLACNEDASRNYYDIEVENLRVNALTNPVFGTAAPRSVKAHRINVTGVSHSNSVLFEGGYIKYAQVGEGAERGVSWDFTNSRFANNKSSFMGRWSDNVYLPHLTFNFEKCLFDDATVYSNAEFAFKNFTGNSRYPRVKWTLTENTFRTTKATDGIIFGGAGWVVAPYDVTATRNRFIGYAQSALPSISDGMEAVASGSKFEYIDNYYAGAYMGADTALGKAPTYASNTSAAVPDPVDVSKLNYYYDYNMTVSFNDLLLTGASFEDNVLNFNINNEAKTVSGVIPADGSLENISFAAGNPETEVKVYADKDCTIEKTSVTADDFVDHRCTFYVKVTKSIKSEIYTVTLLNSDISDFATWTDTTGQIDLTKAAVLVTEGSYATGERVMFSWRGKYYDAPYGTTVFATVAEARAAGKTEILIPVGETGNINIDGPVNIYGNDYDVNPNIPGKKVTDDWAMAESWETDNSIVTGNIVIGAGCTPTTEAGTKIVIKGIDVAGYVNDTTRAISPYKTEIVFENVLVGFDRTITGSSYIFNLNTKGASNTSTDVENIDVFTLTNSRYAVKQHSNSIRIFSEMLPANLNVTNCYFGEGFEGFGWQKARNSIKNGLVNISNNYFYGYSRNIATITDFTGGTQYFDTSVGYNNKAKFNNNVVIDCVANNGAAINVYPASFSAVEIKDNYFISTQNTFGYPFKISTLNYSHAEDDYSDRITFTGNRIIGFSAYTLATAGTKSVHNASDNYYALYTEDYENGVNGTELYGLIGGFDYFLDYAMTVRASDFDMIINHDSAVVDTKYKRASVIIGEEENFIPVITASDKTIKYTVYADKNLEVPVSTINKDAVGSGKLYYVNAVVNGVSVTYELYVSVGNANAPVYEGAYLLDEKTADMPVGTVYTKVFKGTEYKFTAGVNAFASISQITYANGTDTTPTVLVPNGTYAGGDKITAKVNIVGDNAVIKENYDNKAPIKIAAVGDSITEANAFLEKNRFTYGYPAQLNNILDETYGEGNYEVKNFGKGNSSINPVSNSTDTTLVGATRSHYTQGSWYYEALDYNPDVVIIMIGHNDTDTAIFKTKEQYKDYYQQAIDAFRALPSHPQIVISGCHTRSNSYRRDLLVNAVIPAQQELAAENNIIYIDNLTPTIGLGGDNAAGKTNDYVSSDGLHFTASGYRFLAGLIKDGMESILTSDRSFTVDGVTVDENAVVAEKKSRVKVAAIGSEVTYGAASYTNYPTELQKLLGDGYEVRNYGECKSIVIDKSTLTGTDYSWKTMGNYTGLNDYHSSLNWKPDVAIFNFGINELGTYLTSNHSSLNWTNGGSSTAANEFVKDYTALIKEYEAVGTEIYLTTTITVADSNVAVSTVNSLITKMAKDNGWKLIDLATATKDFGDDMYNAGSKLYLSEKGNIELANIIYDSFTIDFASNYVDAQGQIGNDAVVVDYGSNYATGATVVHEWDGVKYTFIQGVNAFGNINDAFSAPAAEDGTIQVIIPANDVVTGGPKFSIANATAAKKMTSIEVYGVNRNIDPVDKSASATDPTADWSLSKGWGANGESGIGVIEILAKSTNTLQGDLIFNGITMRGNYIDTARTAGTTSAPRNLNVVFKNVVVDTTASLGNIGFINDHCTARRNAHFDDSMSFINFYVKSMQTTYRFYAGTGGLTSAHNVFDNFYISSANTGFTYIGWIHGANNYTNSSTVVKNSQFRGMYGFEIAPSSNATAGEVGTIEIKNNLFYCPPSETNYWAVQLCPGFATAITVEDNIFVSNLEASPLKAQANKLDYSLKNNAFIVGNIANLMAAGKKTGVVPTADSTVDMTGCYVAVYADDLYSATGVNPATYAGIKADSYHTSLVSFLSGYNAQYPAFATDYTEGVIKNTAVVLDAGISAQAGEKVTYLWDGKTYSFVVGENAFKSETDLFNAVEGDSVQILIPANSSAVAFTVPDIAKMATIKNIEVFGVNYAVDPNVKDAKDPIAAWTKNAAWGANGTSTVGNITISTKGENTLGGKLTFKGIDFNGGYSDTVRTLPSMEDNRNLEVKFENVVINSAVSYLINDHCTARRNGKYNGDKLIFDSVRLESFTGSRFFASGGNLTSAYVIFEDSFFNAVSYFGFFHGSTGATDAAAIVDGCYFNNCNGTAYSIAPCQNSKTNGINAPVVVTNNVFNGCGKVITICGDYTSEITVDNNYFINSAAVTMLTFTYVTGNIADTLNYSFKNNTVMVGSTQADLDNFMNAARATTTVSGIDVTGTYVGNYGKSVHAPKAYAGFTGTLYLDAAKTLTEADLAVSGVSFDGAAVDAEGKKITATAFEADVIENPALIIANKSLKSEFVVDGKVTTKLDMAKAVDGKLTATANVVKDGVVLDSYTVDFTVTKASDFETYTDKNGIIKAGAVAVYKHVAGNATGDKVLVAWDGGHYYFTVGVNVFATLADVPSTVKQVIMPAAVIDTDLTITRSIEIYGEGFETVPYVIDGEYAAENKEWGANGDTFLRGNIVIAASATPTSAEGTTILVSGIRMGKGINDTARAVSAYKTDVTLKNNVLDRCIYTGEEREFDLRNANTNLNSTSNTNIDSFTIKDMYFVNRNKNGGHALIQEAMPAYLTIDGFVCNDAMASIGFPKWMASVKKGEMKLVNSFFKNHSDASGRFDFVIYFSGHHTNALTTENRAKLDLKLVVENNTFINCGTEGFGGDFSRTCAPLNIYPASFKTFSVSNNDFISTFDYNYSPIMYDTMDHALNAGDMTDKFTMKNNRFVGTLAPWKVNADTVLDMSENYFESYTMDYVNGVTGDTPADTDADFYLDYALTTKVSDMVPTSSNLAGMTVNTESRFIYGYASDDIAPVFTKDGVTYTATETLDVEVGKASKTTVTAVKGNVKLTFTVYVMGVKDVADINNTVDCPVADATVYYPTLYAAPNGIEVVTYYDGKPVKFTTGVNVATSNGMLGFYTDNVIVPDDITDIDLTLVTEVKLYSAVADFDDVTRRKVKISAVGDSITAGGWPEHMQTYLGTTAYTVTNRGQSGATVTTVFPLWFTSDESSERKYTIYAKSKYQSSLADNADVIIIGLGTNDSYYNRWTSNDRYIEQFIELIESYQALESKPAIYITPMTEAYDNHGRTLRRDDNIVYLQYLVAEKTGAKILDARTLTAFMFEPSATEYSTDLLHPTAAGYKLFGELIGEEIQKTFAPVQLHKSVAVAAKDADCETAGHKAYYTCSHCTKVFLDASCVTEIADINAWLAEGGDGYIAPQGHAWGEYVYNNDATTEADGTKTRECGVCHETETVTAEGTKLPSIIPDDRLPLVVLNEEGNGVVTDMRGSWATRVYWGNIGAEDIEYRYFEQGLQIPAGTDYVADYAPRDEKGYYFTKPGYYRFVLKCIVSGTDASNYEYKDVVYTFYYDGKAEVAVPSIEMVDGNHVAVKGNGIAIKKFYYGNIGNTNVPYSWFNDFWSKSLATKSYKAVYTPKGDTVVTLSTKGYYNFVIVYDDENGVQKELVYTVKAEDNVGIIAADGASAVVNLDDIGGTVNKLYWGYVGEDATAVVDYATLKAAAGDTFLGDWDVKDGEQYALDKTGCYGFLVNYTTKCLINGDENTPVNYDILYIIENK